MNAVVVHGALPRVPRTMRRTCGDDGAAPTGVAIVVADHALVDGVSVAPVPLPMVIVQSAVQVTDAPTRRHPISEPVIDVDVGKVATAPPRAFAEVRLLTDHVAIPIAAATSTARF